MLNFFDTTLKIKGFDITTARRELVTMQRQELTTFLENQNHAKWNIFNYHLQNNELYHKNLRQQKKKKIERWSDIPISGKKYFQTNIEDNLSKGFHLRQVFKNSTSGSSGIPFAFAKNKYCHAMTWALIQDRFGRHGLDFNQSLQARFYGIPFEPRSAYYREKIKDLLSRRVRFPVFDLSDRILEKYTTQFRTRPFVYLNGYTSSLVLFAQYLLKQKIVLKEICPTLKRCVTTSEMCDDHDRQTMQVAFGVPVVNEYGAAELDLIAFEDEDFDWILNEETLFIEIVDDNDNALPNGKEGRIIVTSLYNKAMPFIRYELGDIGVIAPERKGVYRILQQLTGRTNDIATLPSGRKIPGLTFYYVTKSLLKKSGLIKELVIKQTAIDQFRVEYVSVRPLEELEKVEVQKLMDTYLEPGLRVTFQWQEKIVRQPSGKLKQFSIEFE